MRVKVNFDGQWLEDVELSFQAFSMQERLQRGLKTFVVFLGVALLSIFVPVLHFVLVPVLLVLSLVMAYQKYREIAFLDVKPLACKGCGTEFGSSQISLKEPESILHFTCNSCRKSTSLMLKADTSAI